MRSLGLWLMAAALLVTTAASVSAQETPAASSPADAVTADDPQPLREQTIYIPYTKLRALFEKEGRGVFLPYEEFQELWRKAREATAQAPEPKPPVDALITEIHSEAVVEKDVVRVTARLKIEVFRAGWHEVPLRLGDAAILSAQLADGPARVAPGDGYRLLLDKSGKEPAQYELTLEYAKAFNKAPGQNSVSFQAPRAPVNRWTIRVPQAGVKVNVYPRLAATEGDGRDENQDRPPRPRLDETVVLAFVGAADEVRIDWTPRAEGATGLAALATIQAQQEISIDDGVIRTQTRLDYDISRAEVTQLLVEVPADHKVVNVYDPNVRSWEFAKNAETQTITVELFEPTRGAQSIVVELEKFSDDLIQAPVRAPVIRGLNVGRQQGLVVVRLSSDLRAEANERSGLLQLDPAELPSSLAKEKWDFSYRYASLPFDLTLNVDKVEPRIQAQQLVEAYLQPDQLTLELFAVYDIDRAGVFQLELEVPSGFDIQQVRGQAGAGAEAAAYDSHSLQGDDATRLLVNLSRKALGRIGLFVELQKRLNEPNLLSPTGQAAVVGVPIPRVAAASVERLSGNLILHAPESLRVRSEQADGLQTISFSDALQQTQSMRAGRFPGLREIMAYAYSQQPTTLALSVQRRKPQVTARQFLVAGIEAGVIRYKATFFYEILYSGVKSLRLDAPAELASQMNLDTKSMQYSPIEPAPDDLAEGYIAWSLTGESEFLGETRFEFSWEQRIDELDVGKSLDVKLPILRPMNVRPRLGPSGHSQGRER